jgi:TerB N-terminal domain/TerB-C domain
MQGRQDQQITVVAVSRQEHWIPPGRSTHIMGRNIPGGSIYVGRHLRSAVGGIEPALINPALSLDHHGPDGGAHSLGPAPSYHLISPASRDAYLAWLAAGRDDTHAPIGFVLLFFSGLERRVLVDAAYDPAVRLELPALGEEVHRLRAIHGPTNSSFHSYAGAFLQVLDLLTAEVGQPRRTAPGGAPPTLADTRWPVPIALRVALAQFAVTGTPVPADWALSWAWHHPSLFPRTPQTRCPQEFERLFTLRYRQRFAAGLTPQTTDRPPVRIGYQPASPGIDAVIVDRPDLPDVLEDPKLTRELGALLDSVTDALTPYSRWLARNPDGLGSLASTALLPAELLDRDTGTLGHLCTWANAHLDGQRAGVIDGSEFGAFWSSADPARMSAEEAGSLAVVLARLGLGVEPDVRFGGPPLGPGPAVLFRLDPLAQSHPSAEYGTAVTMVHLAAGVVAAAAPGAGRVVGYDGDGPTNVVITGLAAHVCLSVSERIRLTARLRWLLASGADSSLLDRRLTRRVGALTAIERETAGRFLVAVAGRPVSPATVTALTGAYRLLRLEPDLVYRRLHQHSIAAASPGEPPIVVRQARPGPPQHSLPREPPAVTSTAPEFQLSHHLVSTNMAETDAVSSILANIFSHDDPVDGSNVAARTRIDADDGTDSGRLGLDEAHSRLLDELITRSSWSRAEFAELADRHGVLPSGALDVINEVAMDIVGEPVIEGDDELTVNDHVLREMLA